MNLLVYHAASANADGIEDGKRREGRYTPLSLDFSDRHGHAGTAPNGLDARAARLELEVPVGIEDGVFLLNDLNRAKDFGLSGESLHSRFHFAVVGHGAIELIERRGSVVLAESGGETCQREMRGVCCHCEQWQQESDGEPAKSGKPH
jgi:hypothetical protein